MIRRDDAIMIGHGATRRPFVPTEFGTTKWISTWEEFRAAGGICCFSEDQTTIELQLPEPYKFGIQFQRGDA